MKGIVQGGARPTVGKHGIVRHEDPAPTRSQPRLLDQIRGVIRRLHYSIRTAPSGKAAREVGAGVSSCVRSVGYGANSAPNPPYIDSRRRLIARRQRRSHPPRRRCRPGRHRSPTVIFRSPTVIPRSPAMILHSPAVILRSTAMIRRSPTMILRFRPCRQHIRPCGR